MTGPRSADSVYRLHCNKWAHFFPSDPLDLGIDDDQHDYDSVASDEDTDSELTTQNNNNTQRSNRAKVSYLNTHYIIGKSNLHLTTCTHTPQS